MLRKAALTIALTLLPAIASAQQHSHGDAAKKQSHEHSTAEMSGQGDFAHFLMEKRAELKLTEEQIAKLEDISARMAQHHAQMKKAGAKPDQAAGTRMHEELMSIFTEEQLVKIRPLMKEHMEAMCGTGEEKQCKVHTSKKAPIQ